MSARLIKITAFVLVVAFVIWLASNMKFKETTVKMPLKGEALHNPFYAAIKLSEALGAAAEWEHIFTTPDTNSVIMVSDWNWTMIRARRERMQEWVEAGGRLVIDGSFIGDFDDFAAWSGIGEYIPDDDEDDEGVDEDEDEDEEESPEEDLSDSERELMSHFIPRQCDRLVEDGSNRELEVCNVDQGRSLVTTRKVLWALRDSNGERIHALRTQVGRGSVTVINATPFRRRDLLDGDNGLLFVRATQLHRGDSLLILTEEDQASILALVWRYGAPALLLSFVLIALGLWRASARFGPLTAATETARRSLAEQIRGTGQFALRFGGGTALHAAMVRALRDAALKHLPAYDRLSSEDRVSAVAKLSGISAEELGPVLNYSGARNSHELRNAIAVLETARRRILLKNKRSKHGN
jgi:hypothetical protein